MLRYTFFATSSQSLQLTSQKGLFIANDRVIGENNTPLNVLLQEGSGSVSETIRIPVAVLKRTEALGTTHLQYQRSFTGESVSVVATVEINVTTGALAEFRIDRVQLYFENGRAEITVRRNQPNLRAYADIRFTGSGILRGYWEVDGRLLSNVNKHLVYGRTVTIPSPEVPSLPTFVSGTHIVRFVITEPSQEIPLPVAVYFVTAEEYRKALSIRLLSPENNREVEYSSLTFSWEGVSGLTAYLVEFMEREGEKVLFSAYTKKTEYTLPDRFLKRIFRPGSSYVWKVKGFGSENTIIAESPLYRFTFKERATYLPGQVIVVTPAERGKEVVMEIGRRYHLRLIDSYELVSLGLRVSVFSTEQEVPSVVRELAGEEGVVIVQPNYIFRTMMEPMGRMQNIRRVLGLERLHQRFLGEGVLVAIIDTGVDTEHEDLADRIEAVKNFIKDSSFRAEIHGTAVAGVIGASINGRGIEGVAPGCRLLALRACRQVSRTSPEGECYSSSVSKAIDFAIQAGSEVVNMSFGSIARDPLLSRLLQEGRRKGILFVAPVGNSPWQEELTFPASHPAVVSVGGLDEDGRFYPSEELARKADVCAPATNILTTVPDNRYNFLNGTSLSGAVVSGILAVARGSGVSLSELPPFRGDICRWQEALLDLSVCR